MLLFEWCEPLAAKGHGDSVAHFLGWSLLVVEGIDNLSTAKVIMRRAIGVCIWEYGDDISRLDSFHRQASFGKGFAKGLGDWGRSFDSRMGLLPRIILLDLSYLRHLSHATQRVRLCWRV